jgi:hypothetical protein
MSAAEVTGESGAFYEWLLSDHPETGRRLADSLGPSAEKSRARAKAAIAEPDEAYVARERGN